MSAALACRGTVADWNQMADLRAGLEEEISLAKAEYDRLSSHIELYMTKMDQQMAAAT